VTFSSQPTAAPAPMSAVLRRQVGYIEADYGDPAAAEADFDEAFEIAAALQAQRSHERPAPVRP
jgi:hypothetical protein